MASPVKLFAVEVARCKSSWANLAKRFTALNDGAVAIEHGSAQRSGRNLGDRQKSFIEALKRDSEAQEGTEILQTPLEDFKNIMREELVEAHDRKGGNEVRGKTIYLLHDRVDQNEVKPYLDMMPT